MKNLPLNLLIEKNKLFTSSAWLILLKIVFPSDVSQDILYLANNNEDITFEGQVYTASSFKLSVAKSNSKGKLSSLQLSIVNVDRLIQQKIEQYNGGLGAVVTITVVNTSYLNPTGEDIEKYKELQQVYDVIGCTSDEQWVTWTLGAPNPVQVKLPLYSFSPVYCQWEYRGMICKYAGAEPSGETTCNHTLEACEARNNQKRFGAFKGMNTKAYNFRF